MMEGQYVSPCYGRDMIKPSVQGCTPPQPGRIKAEAKLTQENGPIHTLTYVRITE
jgi:hypothetical protein